MKEDVSDNEFVYVCLSTSTRSIQEIAALRVVGIVDGGQDGVVSLLLFLGQIFHFIFQIFFECLGIYVRQRVVAVEAVRQRGVLYIEELLEVDVCVLVNAHAIYQPEGGPLCFLFGHDFESLWVDEVFIEVALVLLPEGERVCWGIVHEESGEHLPQLSWHPYFHGFVHGKFSFVVVHVEAEGDTGRLVCLEYFAVHC
jgi:hypothetical protein